MRSASSIPAVPGSNESKKVIDAIKEVLVGLEKNQASTTPSVVQTVTTGGIKNHDDLQNIHGYDSYNPEDTVPNKHLSNAQLYGLLFKGVDHAALDHLDFASSGHTGFQASGADLSIAGMSGAIITTSSTMTSIEELDDSVASQKETGFGAWTSGTDANTYTITGGKFQIDRTGYGYINGKKVIWASGQQTGTLSANTFYAVYIDASGLIQTSTSPFVANVIRLFEVLYDGTIYMVAKENHAKEFPSAVSGFLHKAVGTIIAGTGAIVTRVATGTGASANDRRIKIVGADTLSDHGLDSIINADNPVTWNVFYRNGSGKWIRNGQFTELPIKYNNAGTPTALDVTNAYAEYVLYCIKDDIETASVQYIAVMGETVYTVLATLLADLTAGLATFSTNELKNMEAAQLGYAVVQYSVTGGYIEELQVAKSTLNQQVVGGTAGTGGGVSDHGLLSGLADDDHTQYHNDARGDSRYTQKPPSDGKLYAWRGGTGWEELVIS
jgi:hypothetical protein